MQANDYILALSSDIERFEAALVDVAGRIAHIESSNVPVVSTAGGHVYIEPGQLIRSAVAAIRALLERKPREARRIVGVGIIGRSPSAVSIDVSGPRSPFIFPEDRRVQEDRRSRRIPFDEVYAKVGLTPRLCEIPCLLGWLSGGPGKLAAPKDFLKWFLTGALSTDPLDAQRTFLMDLDTREWSADLCGVFNFERAALPDIEPPFARAGTITDGAARETGLKAGLPVSCGIGDWGEYLGSGVWEISDAFEHIGTTGAFYGVCDHRPAADLDLETRPHVSDGLYLAGRELLPGGTCLEWLLKKSFLARDGVIDWTAVEDELEAIAAMGRPENVLFFARLAEEAAELRTQSPMGLAKGAQISAAAFVNMQIEDNLTSLLQGLMEGVFFNLNAVADQLRSLPWKLRAVFTTGQVGFKHAPRRTRAHIYGVRVHAGRTPGANLVSAALVGAVACGAFATIEEARAAMLNIDGGTVPDETVHREYEAHFKTWLAMRDALTAQQSPPE
ncbi:MAG: xylulokinase [Planctomycetota bacterium]|jgi:sugar (pentulose or hexulose) kinase